MHFIAKYDNCCNEMYSKMPLIDWRALYSDIKCVILRFYFLMSLSLSNLCIFWHIADGIFDSMSIKLIPSLANARASVAKVLITMYHGPPLAGLCWTQWLHNMPRKAPNAFPVMCIQRNSTQQTQPSESHMWRNFTQLFNDLVHQIQENRVCHINYYLKYLQFKKYAWAYINVC